MSNKHDIEIQQGAVFRRVLQWQNPDGTVIDLTGYSGAMQVRPTVASNTILVDLSDPTHGSITFDLQAGLIWIEIKSSHTATLTAPGTAVYDFELIEPGGERHRLLEGKVAITAEVTR
jgi:hypothetical protein